MTHAPVLYAGDSSLQSAAAYLAGLLHSWNIDFDYLPTSRAASAKDIATPRKLFIFSDYPARGLSEALTREVLAQVEAGAGLIMLGGWESYHGVGGNWQASALAHALPVEIAATDDRVNCDQSALVAQVTDHPVIDGLPWDERPPSVGGFNRFRVRPGAQDRTSVV